MSKHCNIIKHQKENHQSWKIKTDHKRVSVSERSPLTSLCDACYMKTHRYFRWGYDGQATGSSRYWCLKPQKAQHWEHHYVYHVMTTQVCPLLQTCGFKQNANVLSGATPRARMWVSGNTAFPIQFHWESQTAL